MNTQFQQLLLEDLREVSGLPIRNGNQCKQVSDKILEASGDLISWQSLRRVLGFIASDSQPTIYTLNVICRYLGYDSYNTYILSKQPKIENERSSSLGEMMEITFNLEQRKEKDFNYHFVCRGLSRYYYDNHKLIKQIPDNVFNYTSFQEYFIGRFPLLDMAHHGFDDLLLKHLSLNGNDEVKLFVQSAIYLHELKSGSQKLELLDPLENIDPDGMHPFTLGRHYGVKLHLASDKKEQDRIIEETKGVLEALSDQEQMSFLFTFLDFLIAKNLFVETLNILDYFDPKPAKFKKWVEFGYFEVFKIYRLLCLSKLNKLEEARKLSKTTSLVGVAFYFRKTFQLMYLEAMIILEKDKVLKANLEQELLETKVFLFPRIALS